MQPQRHCSANPCPTPALNPPHWSESRGVGYIVKQLTTAFALALAACSASSLPKPAASRELRAMEPTVFAPAARASGMEQAEGTAEKARAENVLVVNGPDQSVPIAGTVAAAQSGNWSVSATLEPGGAVGISPSANIVKIDPNSTVTLAANQNVNVSGNVNIANASPLKVQDVHGTIVQQKVGLWCTPFCAEKTIFTVPNEKRMVVEYVTYLGFGDVGSPEALFFHDPNNVVFVPTQSTGITGGGGFIASERVKFYAAAGDFKVSLYASGTTPSGVVTVGGYLEDAL